MIPKALIALLASVGIMVLPVEFASAQQFPSKPIRIITSGPGSPTDIVARLIAEEIAGPLGQPVVVDNRGGMIAVETAVRALPDGYTVLCYGPTTWLLPLLRSNASWNPQKDLAPITQATRAPNALVLHPSVAADSVKALVALAKAKPGMLNYASGAIGSSNHLAMELFKSMAGIDVVRVPYKSTAPALNAMIAGETQLMFPGLNVALPHVKAGRLRALAVTTLEPTAMAPELPTIAASGLPGYESELIIGAFAPAGTPAELVKRLNREIVRALNSEQVKKKFLNLGADPVGSSPEGFAAKVKSEMDKWGKVIKDANLRDK